ncbi:MAG: TetR/AcrR family transcriptional regulator C-terminal domain-containing protein [Pseudonocardia sp.]|nr:TetR/AcrR family transcriptional regulator C-terminal domain-containing protein [Pseudonocardia sp.]
MGAPDELDEQGSHRLGFPLVIAAAASGMPGKVWAPTRVSFERRLDGGPARAITELTHLVAAYAEHGLLRVDDPHVAATHLNWLVIGAPLNEAMLLGDKGSPGEEALLRHVAEAVRIFVTAHT